MPIPLADHVRFKVTLFPEGISRYHPGLAPLKTGGKLETPAPLPNRSPKALLTVPISSWDSYCLFGLVARIAAQLLYRHKDEPGFKLLISTVSVTYLRRMRFRSNVLVSFNPPIVLTPSTYPGLVAAATPGSPHTADGQQAIRTMTATIEASIRAGMLDAPSWRVLNVAHTARRLYAPGGPSQMTLGEYVRLTQAFVDMFAGADGKKDESNNRGEVRRRHQASASNDEPLDKETVLVTNLAVRLKVRPFSNLLRDHGDLTPGWGATGLSRRFETVGSKRQSNSTSF